MHEYQSGTVAGGPAPGQFDVFERGRDPCKVAVVVAGFLVDPQCLDLGAHQRAVNEVVAQQRDARIVAAGFEVAVEETPAEIGIAARVQIHGDECDLADGVYPAQFRVELDTVEQGDDGVDHRHVAEVKITVALAHEAGGFAAIDLLQ